MNWSEVISAITAIVAVVAAIWTIIKNKSEVFKNTSTSASEMSEGIVHIIQPLNERIHALEEQIKEHGSVKNKTLELLLSLKKVLDELINIYSK